MMVYVSPSVTSAKVGLPVLGQHADARSVDEPGGIEAHRPRRSSASSRWSGNVRRPRICFGQAVQPNGVRGSTGTGRSRSCGTQPADSTDGASSPTGRSSGTQHLFDVGQQQGQTSDARQRSESGRPDARRQDPFAGRRSCARPVPVVESCLCSSARRFAGTARPEEQGDQDADDGNHHE